MKQPMYFIEAWGYYSLNFYNSDIYPIDYLPQQLKETEQLHNFRTVAIFKIYPK